MVFVYIFTKQILLESKGSYNIFVEFVRPPAPPPPSPPPPPTSPPPTVCPTIPPELQCPVCVCTSVYHGSYGSLKANEQANYSCSKAHPPVIFGISETFHQYYGVVNCPSLCYAKCGNTYHCCVAPPPPQESENCFPSSARVLLENGKSVTMSELQIGDRVQTGMNIWIFVLFKF